MANGRASGRFTVRSGHMAPNGFMHAASVIALVDSACGYACVASLPEGASGFTTIELKANYLGTAKEGETVACAARLAHGGRMTQVWDAEAVNEDHRQDHGALPLHPDGPLPALRRRAWPEESPGIARLRGAGRMSRFRASLSGPLFQGPAPASGEVAEWSKAPHSKCGVPSRVPWVRIPPLRHSMTPLGVGLQDLSGRSR